MKFQGAVIREQGVMFAIVVVKRNVIQNSFSAKKAIGTFQGAFPRMPIVLMAQDSRGRPTYYGRRDIVKFLSKISLRAIPWREYTLQRI